MVWLGGTERNKVLADSDRFSLSLKVSLCMHIMNVGSYVMEDTRITCSRGASEASPPACNT